MRMAGTEGLYPLTFEPELKEKVWGGRGLASALGKSLPPEEPVGESWEAHGGSVIAGGPLAGRTLDDARRELGAALLGERLAGFGDAPFPLLFKYIDASDWLSVQVHPDDRYAVEHTGHPYGKTEAWCIIRVAPGARLVHGWTRDTAADEVAAAVRENRLEELLEYVPVRAGDVVFVPAGTVHAIGDGIVLAEIQQSSDTTYRLYDWGRMGLDGEPRELHVEESLRTLQYARTERHTIPPLSLVRDGVTRTHLVACRYFALERLESDGAAAEVGTGGGSFALVSALDGPVRLRWDGGELELERGRTALLPAALDVRVGGDAPYGVLRMYVPDLVGDVIEPLRSAGRTMDEIVALGGDARTNDVLAVSR